MKGLNIAANLGDVGGGARQHHCLALDGGLATQLESAGADLSGKLWSARLLQEAPDDIQRAHEAFLQAGCDIITTASYQCSIPQLVDVLQITPALAKSLIARSVRIARAAVHAVAGDRAVVVAASIGPYGACLADGSEYNGHYKTTPPEELAEWHRPRFDVLCDANPDVLAIETIPCRNEVSSSPMYCIITVHPPNEC